MIIRGSQSSNENCLQSKRILQGKGSQQIEESTHLQRCWFKPDCHSLSINAVSILANLWGQRRQTSFLMIRYVGLSLPSTWTGYRRAFMATKTSTKLIE